MASVRHAVWHKVAYDHLEHNLIVDDGRQRDVDRAERRAAASKRRNFAGAVNLKSKFVYARVGGYRIIERQRVGA